MADDRHTLNAEQRRATVLRVVEPFLEVLEGPPRQQVSHLASDRCLQRLFQHGANRVDQPFGNLQRHVADEPVTDNDVDVAIVKVPSLDVADEVHGHGLQHLEGLAGEFVALGFLFSNREQCRPVGNLPW